MADTSPIIRSFSVFAGGGFHDTAIECALDALGYRLLPVGFVEWDAAAAYTLLARMENATLRRAPVWIDSIANLDARPLRGFVDLLIASPPCQPYSSAGKRAGNTDRRSHGDGDGPLVHLVRVIDECEPAVVWFENVPEWFTDGHFREFGEQLCGLGFDIAPPFFATSAGYGNVHERERVFVLLVHAERLRAWQGEQGEHAGLLDGDRLAEPGGAVGDVANTGCRSNEQRTVCAGKSGSPRPDEAEARKREWCGTDAGCSVRIVDNSAGARHEPARSRKSEQPERRECLSGVGCNNLAVHACGGLGAVRQQPRGGGQPDGCDDGVADAQGEGCEGPEPARDRRPDGRLGEQRGFVPPLHPPGRPIFDDELAAFIGRDSTTLGALRGRIAGTAEALRQWMELAAAGLDPTLMPAIEPGVPVVVDVAAPPASDLLRLGGNGVDVVVAARAFIDAWLSAGLPRGGER